MAVGPDTINTPPLYFAASNEDQNAIDRNPLPHRQCWRWVSHDRNDLTNKSKVRGNPSDCMGGGEVEMMEKYGGWWFRPTV